jgi:hypothetical protein
LIQYLVDVCSPWKTQTRENRTSYSFGSKEDSMSILYTKDMLVLVAHGYRITPGLLPEVRSIVMNQFFKVRPTL